ncbi:MAG: hypothetical protein IPJ88_04175 [Myxococcales bacterium]|nr:MAG: hypothetical protein IPJ88_04175 [Myxococcales bacterium]
MRALVGIMLVLMMSCFISTEAWAQDAKPNPNDPKELSSERYSFIGMRFRDLIIPKFVLNLFAKGGSTVNVFTFGPEFTTRKGGTELNIALSYADYSMDPFLFKGKGDGEESWERVSSDLKAIYGTIDLLFEVWTGKRSRYAFLIGGGVGLGAVFDNLHRTQVYPNDPSNPNPDNPSAWRDCTSAGNPATTTSDGAPWCGADNNHYPGYSEPSWAHGGAKPFIFPWLSIPQFSFRYKPIKQFQMRADAGLSISGIFFGLNAAYGLN